MFLSGWHPPPPFLGLIHNTVIQWTNMVVLQWWSSTSWPDYGSQNVISCPSSVTRSRTWIHRPTDTRCWTIKISFGRFCHSVHWACSVFCVLWQCHSTTDVPGIGTTADCGAVFTSFLYCVLMCSFYYVFCLWIVFDCLLSRLQCETVFSLTFQGTTDIK